MKKRTILVLSLVLTFFIQAVVVFGVGAADTTITGSAEITGALTAADTGNQVYAVYAP